MNNSAQKQEASLLVAFVTIMVVSVIIVATYFVMKDVSVTFHHFIDQLNSTVHPSTTK